MTDRPEKRSHSSWWMICAFLGGIIAVFVGISFAQEVQRRLALQRHVSQLQEEIGKREQRISTLQQFTEYLETDAYRERAAREKLNYQRPNEHVVVIPERGQVLDTEEARVQTTPAAPLSIPRQWWEHLFGPSP